MQARRRERGRVAVDEQPAADLDLRRERHRPPPAVDPQAADHAERRPERGRPRPRGDAQAAADRRQHRQLPRHRAGLEREVAADLGERGKLRYLRALADEERAADPAKRRELRVPRLGARSAERQVPRHLLEQRQHGRGRAQLERARDDARAAQRGDLDRIVPVPAGEVALPQLDRVAHARRPVDLDVREHAVAVVIDARLHGDAARRALERRLQRILAHQHRRRPAAQVLDALDLGVVEHAVAIVVEPRAERRAAVLAARPRRLDVTPREQLRVFTRTTGRRDHDRDDHPLDPDPHRRGCYLLDATPTTRRHQSPCSTRGGHHTRRSVTSRDATSSHAKPRRVTPRRINQLGDCAHQAPSAGRRAEPAGTSSGRRSRGARSGRGRR